MIDAIIILLACNASHPDTQCVPFFVHEVRIERAEDCEQEIRPILETFATKAPSDTVIRGICTETPKELRHERSA